VGAVHLMSKGFAVKTPDDVKGKKPFMWRDDDSQPTLYQVIGGVTPVPLNVPEVLPQLNEEAVNIVYAPPLLAEEFQWSAKLDTINQDVSAMAVGALVISSKRLDALSQENRNLIVQTGLLATNALTKRIRADDDAAFARMKTKMTVVTLSADQQSKWTGLFKQVRTRLKQGTFAPDLVDKLEALAK
jgi:TRAP-type C4-dicarboxylate transport system substrate-binding protein